jgi:type I restriction enzyme S subunit
MELKPGYKQTEVGVIPEDWTVETLGELGQAIIGLTYKPEQVADHGTLVLRSSNIQDCALKFEDNVFVHADIPSEIMAQPGDVLVCVRNGSRDLIGKTALLDERTNGMTFGAFMAVFRSPIGSLINYHFQSSALKQQVNAHLGATINQITNRSLRSFQVILPPTKRERDSIVEALQVIDDLIGNATGLIAKKRNIKQAAMQELLTGKRRLPGFEGEWEVKRLREIGKCYRGVSYKGDADLMPHDTANTIRLLRSNNVQDSFVKISELKHVYNKRVATHQILTRDDIVICMANGSKALVGKAGRFQVNDGYKYTFGAFMGCFRTNLEKADPGFTFYLLQTERYQRLIGDLLAGSSINNLKPSSIESLEFLFPERAEQLAIATVLSDIDAELTSLQNRRDSIQEVKQGMMQQLLTGKIRLR